MINQLLIEIFQLIVRINEQGKHHVFLNLSPHVDEISIMFFKNKWEEGRDYTDMRCYYDRGKDSKKQLNYIKKELLKYCDEYCEEDI